MQLACEEVLELDTDKLPTGKKRAVDGTAFDFREATVIGDAIEALKSGLSLVDLFGAPTYLVSLIERVQIRLQPDQQSDFQRVVCERIGEIVAFTERCRTPETKLEKLLGGLASQKTLSE